MATAEMNNNESLESVIVHPPGSCRSSSLFNLGFIQELPRYPSLPTNLRRRHGRRGYEKNTKKRISRINLAPVPSKFKELTPLPFPDNVQKKMYTKSDEYYLKEHDEHKYGKCKLDGKCHKCKYLLRNPEKDALRQAKYFEQMKDYRPNDADLTKLGEVYDRYYNAQHPEYVKQEYWQDHVMNNVLVPIYNAVRSVIKWFASIFARKNNQVGVEHTSVPEISNNESIEESNSVLDDGHVKSNEITPDLAESDSDDTSTDESQSSHDKELTEEKMVKWMMKKIQIYKM